MENRNNNIITPNNLIECYVNGIFPMSNSREDKEVFFVDPEYRTLIPIKGFHFSKSLKRLIKKRPFNITINKCFPDVIRACAIYNRDETWINLRIQNLFISLNEMKYAHSIECWQDKKLVGGIYGLAIGTVFFAESMFSKVPNGSKIALSNLVAKLWQENFKILDVQFLNEHLIQFGAFEITKSQFKEKLALALKTKAIFHSKELTDDDLFENLSSFIHANIEMS